ncbi:hypothetical protein UY3_13337 [Chelonia mydas]|uniref:Uncharacterized protein n=1 Tax=Chelonia mydas TaxID=8469 RepID=M7BMV7_CHEMY|nr:hypothetical protein UY3_13337 [Chelonia mydas]
MFSDSGRNWKQYHQEEIIWDIITDTMTGFRVTAVLVCIRKKKRSTCGTLETNQFI